LIVQTLSSSFPKIRKFEKEQKNNTVTVNTIHFSQQKNYLFVITKEVKMNDDEWQPSLIEKWALVSMVNYNCAPTVQLSEEEIAAKFNISLTTLRREVANYHRQVDEGVLVPDLAKPGLDYIPEKSIPRTREVGFLERIGGSLWPTVRLSRRPATEDVPYQGVQYSSISGKAKSDNLLNQFYHFRIATASPYVAFAVAVFILLSNIAYWILVFRKFIAPSSIAICVVSLLFSVVLFWILIYLRFALPLTDQHGKYLFLMATMESCVALGIVTTIGCCLLMRSLRPCEKEAPLEDISYCSCKYLFESEHCWKSWGRNFSSVSVDFRHELVKWVDYMVWWLEIWLLPILFILFE
jgi:hypothetical protein